MLRYNARRLHSLVLTADILIASGVFLLLVSLPGMLVAAPSGAKTSIGLILTGLVAALAWPLALAQLDLYGSQRRKSLSDILSAVIIAGMCVTALVTAAVIMLRVPVAPVFPVVCGMAQLVAFGGFRLSIYGILRLARRSGRNYRRIAIVGSGPRAQQIRNVIQSHPEWGLRIVGFVDDADTPVDPKLSEVEIHKIADFPSFLREEVIDEVILACPRSMFASVSPVIGLCADAGVTVTLPGDVFGDYLPPPRVTQFDSTAALSFAPVYHPRVKLAVKRSIDILGASVLLALSAPVIGVAAVLIRANSPGPAFFRQVRCSLHGRRFEMLKLRTMCADAENKRGELLHLNEMDGPVFKIRDDPRVTPVGRVLRKWSIDELPQLWNVLKGDMSIVGPRPPIPGEVADYTTVERRRLSMRPGITCLWQVSGRNAIGFADWVKLDLEYIDGWSLRRDFGILLKTIPAVLKRTGE